MEMESSGRGLFRTEGNYLFAGVSSTAFQEILNQLSEYYGLAGMQICEAASYSMAMVVRVALGLSADRAVVGALVSDNLSGWITLATLRHLRNGGSECHLVIPGEPSSCSADFALQLKPLQKMGVPISYWNSASQHNEMSDLVLRCHALICGLADCAAQPGQQRDDQIDVLNELKTPIHCIQAPPGVDCNTGDRVATPLFASSTLSLGVPLGGLHKAADFVGRHYLCDISITNELYMKEGFDLTPLFAEQPVIQIFPVSADQAQA